MHKSGTVSRLHPIAVSRRKKFVYGQAFAGLILAFDVHKILIFPDTDVDLVTKYFLWSLLHVCKYEDSLQTK
jgi:hypothetical protein